MTWYKYVTESQDSGALLGLGFGLLARVAAYSFVLEFAAKFKLNSYQSKIHLGKHFAGIVGVLAIIEAYFLAITLLLEQDEDGNLLPFLQENGIGYIIGRALTVGGMALAFMNSIIGLTAILAIASGTMTQLKDGKEQYWSKNPLPQIIGYHAIFTLIVGAMSIIAFLKNTGYIHVAWCTDPSECTNGETGGY